jgi:hypothetical protein
MPKLRIVVCRGQPEGRTEEILGEFLVEAESARRLTKVRVARLLAANVPSFRRRRGRAGRGAGLEILPVLERTPSGWRAWRLLTADDQPSGFEPPLTGRVGKTNSADNPFADRSKGSWARAEVSVVSETNG